MGKLRGFFKKYRGEIKTVIWAMLIALVITLAISFAMSVNVFSLVSAYLQYVTVILAVLAWNNTRKLLENREKQIVHAKNNDMILMVSLANDIQSDVSTCLKSLEGEDAILSKLEPIELEGGRQKDKILTPNSRFMDLMINEEISGALTIKGKKDMPTDGNIVDYVSEFQTCIKKVYDIMTENSTERLHVFIAAPVGMAAYITPFFVNKKTMIMYRYVKESPRKYVQMGPVENRVGE